MKKILIFTTLLLLLFSLTPHVQAAGTATVTGPSTVRAGDTITVSFRAGGGILGGQGTISYDSDLLTLNSCTASLGGSWVVEITGNNFVFYDNNMSNPLQSTTTIFTMSFSVKANVAPGTALSVTASGVTLSDGKQDLGAGSPKWSATVAPPLSGNCDLKSLSLSAGISPAFNPAVTNYSASVPFTTSSLSVNAQAADSKAKVSVSNPGLTAGGTTEIRVTVTAENGATKTYTIRVARAQDPNYVPSNDTGLEGITVTGELLALDYSHEKCTYYLWLPYQTESIKITGKATDSKATVSVGEIPALIAGGVVTASVTVTAEDQTQQIYPVYIFRAPALADMDTFFQAVQNYSENPLLPAEPTEPVSTEPTEATDPTVSPETEPQPTVPAPDKTEDVSSNLLLWAGSSLLAGALIGFTVTFLATRPRRNK